MTRGLRSLSGTAAPRVDLPAVIGGAAAYRQPRPSRGSRPRRRRRRAAERRLEARGEVGRARPPAGRRPCACRTAARSGRGPGSRSPLGATCRMPAALNSGTVTGVASTIAAMICGSLIARRAASACAARRPPRSSEVKLTASAPPPARASASFSPSTKSRLVPPGSGQRVDRDRAADDVAAARDALVLVVPQPARTRARRSALHAPPGGRCPRASRRARSSTAARAAPPGFHSLCLTPGGITTVSPARTSASSSPRRIRPAPDVKE